MDSTHIYPKNVAPGLVAEKQWNAATLNGTNAVQSSGRTLKTWYEGWIGWIGWLMVLMMVSGGGYNTKHVAKYFRIFSPASGQLHFDGVINLKGAGTRSEKEIKMYEQQ